MDFFAAGRRRLAANGASPRTSFGTSFGDTHRPKRNVIRRVIRGHPSFRPKRHRAAVGARSWVFQIGHTLKINPRLRATTDHRPANGVARSRPRHSETSFGQGRNSGAIRGHPSLFGRNSGTPIVIRVIRGHPSRHSGTPTRLSECALTALKGRHVIAQGNALGSLPQ